MTFIKETAIQIIDIKEKPLALTNDGQLEVFFLGTGSAFASSLYQTNLLLIKGNVHVLVDFGMTGPASLREVAGLQPTDIEVFLPTHSHADHVGGVECLALMNRYVGMRFMNKPRLRMIVTHEYESMLWEQTLRGGLSCNESGQQDQGLTFQDFFEPLRPSLKSESQRETFTITLPCGPGNDLAIEMFRTMHVPEQETSWRTCSTSYGLLVDERVFFSGDTRFDRELLDAYAPRAEIMFHDVQFFPGAVHAPLSELSTLPAAMRNKILLVHYADNWQEQDISGFAGWARQGVLYRF